jgi:hypothetical protein
MKIVDLFRKFFMVLMLSFMAMAFLPACSSSEESAPPPTDTGGSGCGDPDACAPEDLQCREAAIQECDI